MRMVLLAAGLFLMPARAADEASKKDLDRMQGDWAAASLVRDGQALPDDDAQSLFRTVKGDRYTVFRFKQTVGKGTFQVDATRTPRTIDYFPDTPQGKGPAVRGIYEFVGEKKYRVCYAPPGKDRPTEFASKPDSGHTLVVWEPEPK
jgi:uncharacterized protein (TIGR03067 family)